MICNHSSNVCRFNCLPGTCAFFSEHAERTYKDGLRFAAQLIREYEIEHNKLYRERLAQHIEEKAK